MSTTTKTLLIKVSSRLCRVTWHDRTSERDYYNVERKIFAFDTISVLRLSAEQTVHS